MKNSKRLMYIFMAALAAATAITSIACKDDVVESVKPGPERLTILGGENGIEVWGMNDAGIQTLKDAWDNLDDGKGNMIQITSKITRINMIHGSTYDKNGEILNIGTSLNQAEIESILVKIARGELVLDNSRETVRMAMKFGGNTRGA